MRRPAPVACAAGLLLAVMGCGAGGPAPSRRAAGAQAWIRINQAGTPDGVAPRALLASRVAETGATWRVVGSDGSTVAHGTVGRRLPAWNGLLAHIYELPLPVLPAGADRVEVAGPAPASSPPLHVAPAAALAQPVLADAVRFFTAQRDGADVDPSVLDRKPSHLTDRRAFEYAPPRYRNDRLLGTLRRVGGPVDVSGGWFDAGDYLKFFGTASFADALLAWTERDHAAAAGAAEPQLLAEVRRGTEWLLKTWDPRHRLLRYQVGIGDGNARFLGDHDVNWRLPQVDDRRHQRPGGRTYFVQYRPVFVQRGSISPNLAGRGAAAFALAAQLFASRDPAFAQRCLAAARSLFAAARTSHVGRLVFASPYDYYPEIEWRDDMELGAAELALASRTLQPAAAPRYARLAGYWLRRYHHSPLVGYDSLNLYDVGGLADAEVARADPAMRTMAIADLRSQLVQAEGSARRDPFGYGARYADGDVTQHALGLAIEARLAYGLTQDPRWLRLAHSQLDLVMGANAWGTTWVVGAGQTFPHCLHHAVANLVGSLDGTSPLLLGAVVPGPAAAADTRHLGVPDGTRHCPPAGGNGFAPFDAHGARYLDTVTSDATSEPTDDGAALLAAAVGALGS